LRSGGDFDGNPPTGIPGDGNGHNGNGKLTPLRRETDVLGLEIVSAVVDDHDQIRMVRVKDVARTPPLLRGATGKDFLASIPDATREDIRMIVAHVRQTGSHYEGEYDSHHVPGERRLIRAHPGTRPGWVALAMLAIPVVQAADDDDDDLLVAQR
jgi:hypothetical protein